jgi:hypothetical protein
MLNIWVAMNLESLLMGGLFGAAFTYLLMRPGADR